MVQMLLDAGASLGLRDENGDDAPDRYAGGARPFALSLEVLPEAFGRLRMRCWSEGEERPSSYSAEVKLPRFLGKSMAGKDQARTELEKKRAAYYADQPKPSANAWAPAGSKPAAKKTSVVPYGVPTVPRVEGVRGGGGGANS